METIENRKVKHVLSLKCYKVFRRVDDIVYFQLISRLLAFIPGLRGLNIHLLEAVNCISLLGPAC